jgi:hypothetical protein
MPRQDKGEIVKLSGLYFFGIPQFLQLIPCAEMPHEVYYVFHYLVTRCALSPTLSADCGII